MPQLHRLALALLGALFAIPVIAEEPTKPISSPLAAALVPFVEHSTLAGAVVLVADRDKVLATEAVGFADVAAKVPMKHDSLFWIASQSKPITAAGIMILVDAGKVKLDDPVSKYLPELTNLRVVAEKDADHILLQKPTRAATVRDLLAHTSGMPFRSAVEEPTLDALPLKLAIKSYGMTPLDSNPGTKYQYSNCGINTAGRIIEVVSGMPYEKFMDERLFGPLGMSDTTFWPSAEQVKRLAKAYKPGNGGKGLVEFKIDQLQYPLSERVGRYPMPAGGLFSSAGDVGKFCRMMLNNGTLDGKRILSEAAVKEMSTRQTPATMKESYGLGLSVGGDWYGHGGALSTNMTIDVKRGLVYVWLIQHAGFPKDGDIDGGKSQDAFRRAAEVRFGVK